MNSPNQSTPSLRASVGGRSPSVASFTQFSRLDGLVLKKEYSYTEATGPFYEYLLKGWVHSQYRNITLQNAFHRALHGIDAHLLHTSYHGGYSFVGSLANGKFRPEMEQYACSVASALSEWPQPQPSTR